MSAPAWYGGKVDDAPLKVLLALVGQPHLASHSDKSREHESNPERRWWVNLVSLRTPSERGSDPNLRPRDRHS
jgi:hypothetical protein